MQLLNSEYFMFCERTADVYATITKGTSVFFGSKLVFYVMLHSNYSSLGLAVLDVYSITHLSIWIIPEYFVHIQNLSPSIL